MRFHYTVSRKEVNEQISAENMSIDKESIYKIDVNKILLDDMAVEKIMVV
jgi:hypothetical protein